jgi:hypothetical protein
VGRPSYYYRSPGLLEPSDHIRKSISRIFIVFLTATLLGCSSVIKDPKLIDHVIVVNERGQAIDPANYPEPVNIKAFDCQLDEIVDKIQAWKPSQDKLDHGRKRIVIFIHGGLNSPADAMQRAHDTYFLPMRTSQNPNDDRSISIQGSATQPAEEVNIRLSA